MLSSTPLIVSFTLLLSLPLLFLLLFPKLIPPRPQPISLPDELDDLILFHKASLPPKPTTAAASLSHLSKPNPHPKIAFLFLTNSNLHFYPLWEKFFNNSQNLFNIYIHADPSTHFTPPIPNLFNHRFITSKHTQRGSPSLIAAARRLLATAILDDPQNFFFALLSQHCVPLHSIHFLYRSLFSRRRSSWFARFGPPKFQSFIEIIDKDPNLKKRYRARGENVMMPEVPFEKFRVGSQFFVLTRTHALLVIKDRKLWRKFRLAYIDIQSCYPEEHYFPTLLSMEDPQGCTNFALTRVNWTGSVDGHPHTYRPEQVSPELIYRLRVSNSSYSYMFARKFSQDCLNPLMEIADDVIFQD